MMFNFPDRQLWSHECWPNKGLKTEEKNSKMSRDNNNLVIFLRLNKSSKNLMSNL
jgi:hypothetical protein